MSGKNSSRAKNSIILESTKIEQKRITYKYHITGQWERYFTKTRQYTLTYEENISNIPESICNIQFVANILPMVWIFDATLETKTLDKAFADSISKFKDSYIKMYPQIRLLGKLKIDKIIDNNYQTKNNVGAFFSGGLDAASTVAVHYDEHPLLINIQGSDINLRYKKILSNVRTQLKNTAKGLNLDITFIRSEFKDVVNEKKINKYIKPIVHDNYWHAFQHGIAIISHASPLAYIYRLRSIYIASSYTAENHAPCASDPTIDNYVKLASTSIIHDGYEYNRVDKSSNVANFVKKYNKPFPLRVCLDDYRAENCCNCEKCYRTIFNFAANGYDPNLVGFKLDDRKYKKIEKSIKHKTFIQFPALWKDIQQAFLQAPELKNRPEYQWIYNYNFDTVNNYLPKYLYKFYRAIKKRIQKITRLINQG